MITQKLTYIYVNNMLYIIEIELHICVSLHVPFNSSNISDSSTFPPYLCVYFSFFLIHFLSGRIVCQRNNMSWKQIIFRVYITVQKHSGFFCVAASSFRSNCVNICTVPAAYRNKGKGATPFWPRNELSAKSKAIISSNKAIACYPFYPHPLSRPVAPYRPPCRNVGEHHHGWR